MLSTIHNLVYRIFWLDMA